jgi:3-phosphoshikimate 1-carboxyvinyltransferase
MPASVLARLHGHINSSVLCWWNKFIDASKLKPDTLTITPELRPFTGIFHVPGDKSLSHRALILGAMCPYEVSVTNLNSGADVGATAAALQYMGARIELHADRALIKGPTTWQSPRVPLDLGNAGTSARLLMGLITGAGIKATLQGDASLSRRPMGRVLTPLTHMGLEVEEGAENHLPLTIARKGPLKTITYTLPMPSAQVKAAILIAGAFGTGTTTLINPFAIRDHTIRMMAHLGFAITQQGEVITITHGVPPGPARTLPIANDPSAAAFGLIGALLTPSSGVSVEGVLYNPCRAHFIEVLRRMGAQIHTRNNRAWGGEPIVDVTAIYTPQLTRVVTEPEEAAMLIDEFPILAVAAAHAQGTSCFKGVGELRVKESDRLHKVIELIQAFGGNAWVHGDDLYIEGSLQRREQGITIHANHDHRIAMSAAILARSLGCGCRIEGASTIHSSFPQFTAQV